MTEDAPRVVCFMVKCQIELSFLFIVSGALAESVRNIKSPHVHSSLVCTNSIVATHVIAVFSRVLRDSTPRFVGPSVRPLVRLSVRPSVRHTLLFLGFCGLWPHCPCPNDRVTSNMAPAHPHATEVAVYPALFLLILLEFYVNPTPILHRFCAITLS